MPHDAVTQKQTILLGEGAGQHDRILLEKYEAPSDGEGGIAADSFKEQDIAIARNMQKWLNREYPGHMWGCISDLRQGIVKFNLPILMGVNNWWVINLRTHEIIDGLRAGAGQILERYGLRRGRFQLTQFLEAREKHSALLVKNRKVPE